MDADRNTVYKRILKLSWNDSQGSCRDDSDEEMINSLHELHYLKHLIDMIIVDLESSTQVSVLEMVLTSVGYILSGIWVQNSDISPLVSLKPSDALAESIIKLTQHTELRIRLLAVFVISNQATPSFFSNHVPRIMHELSGILMQSESIKSKSRVSLEDVCFSQCISALVCMRDQFPHCIAKYLSLDLIEGLFEWLIAAMSSETPDQHYSDDHILLLKDVSSIIRLCSYTLALHLLVRAHSTLPVLSEAIKKLSSMKRQALELACDLWTVWLHLLASLLHCPRPVSDLSSSSPSLETTRKLLAAVQMNDHLGKVICNGQLTCSPLEAKLIFFEFVAPLNSAGALVTPLQRIFSHSRGLAARCYWLLAQQVTVAEAWHQPSAVLRLLLRCCHHFLLLCAPTATISADDNAAGILWAGAIVCHLLSSTPEEYAEEVWKVSVSTASNEGKESVTLRTLYHSMETMANAFSSQHLPSLDLNGESNSPRKRLRSSESPSSSCVSPSDEARFRVWVWLRAVAMEVSLRRWHIALQSHLLPQPSIYSVKAAFEHANVLGLFDCQRGFRRCDLLRSPLPFSSMLVGGQELPTFQEMAAFATSVLVHLMDRSQEHHSTQAYVAALQRLWQCGVLGEMRCVFAVIITEHPLAPGPGDEGLSQAFFSGGSGAVYHGTQSLAFSYREDSSNGTACAANSSEDQVVLLAEHPSISTFLHSLFFSGLQIVAQVLRRFATKTALQSAWPLVITILESLWWALHRTSSFLLPCPVEWSQLVSSIAEAAALSWPSVPSLPLISAALCATIAATSMQPDRLFLAKTGHHGGHLLLLEAVRVCVNGITESAALPHVLGTLHDVIATTYSPSPSLPPSSLLLQRHNAQRSPICPSWLYLVVGLFVRKLAEMAAPDDSDALSEEVLNSLLQGLRHLLVLPLSLLDLIPYTDVLRNDDEQTKVRIALQRLMDAWLVLEQLRGKSSTRTSAQGSTAPPSALLSVTLRPFVSHVDEMKRLGDSSLVLSTLERFVASAQALPPPGNLYAEILARAMLGRALHSLALLAVASEEETIREVWKRSGEMLGSLRSAGLWNSPLRAMVSATTVVINGSSGESVFVAAAMAALLFVVRRRVRDHGSGEEVVAYIREVVKSCSVTLKEVIRAQRLLWSEWLASESLDEVTATEWIEIFGVSSTSDDEVMERERVQVEASSGRAVEEALIMIGEDDPQFCYQPEEISFAHHSESAKESVVIEIAEESMVAEGENVTEEEIDLISPAPPVTIEKEENQLDTSKEIEAKEHPDAPSDVAIAVKRLEESVHAAERGGPQEWIQALRRAQEVATRIAVHLEGQLMS